MAHTKSQRFLVRTMGDQSLGACVPEHSRHQSIPPPHPFPLDDLSCLTTPASALPETGCCPCH